jgi:hypothetical protein
LSKWVQEMSMKWLAALGCAEDAVAQVLAPRRRIGSQAH